VSGFLAIQQGSTASSDSATNCDAEPPQLQSHASSVGTSLLQSRASSVGRTIQDNDRQPQAPPRIDYGHPSWLESCQSIYLDVGSNVGVQIRKLYEPRIYPGGKVLPLFEQNFGPPTSRCALANVSGLCALGLEPNPLHHPRLRSIEQAYADRGWHVHFYPFAAAYEDGTSVFEVGISRASMEYWGARLALRESQPISVNVTTIDFGLFIKSLPMHKIRLMKMDIEGAEWDALASMEGHNALCGEWVRAAFIEAHTIPRPHGSRAAHWQSDQTFAAIQARLASQSCNAGTISMINFDDESYLHDVATPPGHGSDCWW